MSLARALQVTQIDPTGAAMNLLSTGDLVLQINGNEVLALMGTRWALDCCMTVIGLLPDCYLTAI